MAIKLIEILKILESARIAKRVGAEGHILILTVALREDSLRGIDVPRFWIRELMEVTGVKSRQTLTRIRDRCVELEYIAYKTNHRDMGEYSIGPKILDALQTITSDQSPNNGHKPDTSVTQAGHKPDTSRTPSTPTLSYPVNDTQPTLGESFATEDEDFMDLWGWLQGRTSERFDKTDIDYSGEPKIRADDLVRMEDIHKCCVGLQNMSLSYDDIAMAWMRNMQMYYHRRDAVSGAWYIKSFCNVMSFSMVTDLLKKTDDEILRVHDEYLDELNAKKDRLNR